jgi:hypothetical protein
VIVVGVLVALALDGWWQTREERVRESAYLEAVVAELQSHITELEASLAGNRTAHDALERARQIRRDGQHPDSARAFLSSLVEALTYLVVPTVSTAVYDDLVSTGNIRLIRDDVARGTVLETYSSIEANLERLSIAEESIRPGLNALVSRYLPPNTVSRGTAVFDVRVSEESADTPALRAAAEMIAADEAFEQELNAEYRRLERARQQIARHVEITQAYLQRIQGEVARVQPTRHL